MSLLLPLPARCSLLNLTGLVVQQHVYQVVYHTPIDHTARLFVDRVNLMRRKILTGPLEARLGEPETDMRGRDPGFADFRGSDPGGIDLSGGSLRGAVLQGTSLRRAVLVDLDQAELSTRVYSGSRLHQPTHKARRRASDASQSRACDRNVPGDQDCRGDA